jgi:hypothetical protein
MDYTQPSVKQESLGPMERAIALSFKKSETLSSYIKQKVFIVLYFIPCSKVYDVSSFI